jgi:sialic acid synthase SpsE
MLLSTGMSYLSEVKMALHEIYPHNKNVILLQCTANYPIRNDETNLKVINTYKDNFDILPGFSDHSVGVGASPYAVAMGARVVEKHFTVDKSGKGPDHKASLSPQELKEYVKQIRETEQYLGTEIKTPTFDEIKTRQALQKFLVAAKPIKKGEIFTEENIIAKRTGGVGISPVYYKSLLKKRAKKDYKIDDIIDE